MSILIFYDCCILKNFSVIFGGGVLYEYVLKSVIVLCTYHVRTVVWYYSGLDFATQ
jgi:hypothetical protein